MARTLSRFLARSEAARWRIAARYLAISAVLHLGWEIAQSSTGHRPPQSMPRGVGASFAHTAGPRHSTPHSLLRAAAHKSASSSAGRASACPHSPTTEHRAAPETVQAWETAAPCAHKPVTLKSCRCEQSAEPSHAQASVPGRSPCLPIQVTQGNPSPRIKTVANPPLLTSSLPYLDRESP